MDAAQLHRDAVVIDGLIVANFSRAVFEDMRRGGITAANCTCCVWEDFRDTMANVARWKTWFADNADLITQVYTTTDIARAKREGRVGIILGWQNLSGIDDRLGYLQLQLFRARPLVADTGLHAMKWTRQQVIDYGFTPQETERYIVWPGQACSYMIGQLRILELREKAKAALGAKFSIKEFHNVVLRGGSMPLSVLAQEVDAWVTARKAGG